MYSLHLEVRESRDDKAQLPNTISPHPASRRSIHFLSSGRSLSRFLFNALVSFNNIVLLFSLEEAEFFFHTVMVIMVKKIYKLNCFFYLSEIRKKRCGNI